MTPESKLRKAWIQLSKNSNNRGFKAWMSEFDKVLNFFTNSFISAFVLSSDIWMSCPICEAAFKKCSILNAMLNITENLVQMSGFRRFSSKCK